MSLPVRLQRSVRDSIIHDRVSFAALLVLVAVPKWFEPLRCYELCRKPVTRSGPIVVRNWPQSRLSGLS